MVILSLEPFSRHLGVPCLDPCPPQREIFGPILPILAVSTVDEAISMVKSREHPLAAYLFTSSWASRKKFCAVEAGGVAINDCVLHLSESDAPFGGKGPSGVGRYHGRHGFVAFSHVKHSLFKLPLTIIETMRYPPISSMKKLATRAVFMFNGTPPLC